MKTFTATPADIQHDWYVVDADGMVLGRLATEVAQIIRGKHKPTYTPHMDTGDFVIVINARKVRVTGRKAEQKRTSVTPATWVTRGTRRSPTCWPSTPSASSRRRCTACCRRPRSAAEAAPQAGVYAGRRAPARGAAAQAARPQHREGETK